MKNTDIMLDTANLEAIKEGIKYFNISGLTTNPTILKQSESNDFVKTVNEIIDIIGKERSLHLQLVSPTTEGMVKEAEFFKATFDCNLYVKIPVCKNGLEAMKILKEKGFKITATGIISSMQILMAASCGADYAAPYVNRIEMIGGDAEQVIAEARALLDENGLDTKILGASFKNPNQIKMAMLAGSHSVTAAYEVIEASIMHPLTDVSLENFEKDFIGKYGHNNFVEMYDL